MRVSERAAWFVMNERGEANQSRIPSLARESKKDNREEGRYGVMVHKRRGEINEVNRDS